MEREVTERFERIEADLAVTASGLVTVQKTLATVAQSQVRLQEMLGDLVQNMTRYVDASDARMKRVEESIAHYTDASDARMRRMEENLDALIRAITAEHSNGRGKAQ